jgi:hypothetical protein
MMFLSKFAVRERGKKLARINRLEYSRYSLQASLYITVTPIVRIQNFRKLTVHATPLAAIFFAFLSDYHKTEIKLCNNTAGASDQNTIYPACPGGRSLEA